MTIISSVHAYQRNISGLMYHNYIPTPSLLWLEFNGQIHNGHGCTCTSARFHTSSQYCTKIKQLSMIEVAKIGHFLKLDHTSMLMIVAYKYLDHTSMLMIVIVKVLLAVQRQCNEMQ